MTDKLPDKPKLPDKLPEPKELTDKDVAEVALECLPSLAVEDFVEAAQILDFLGYVEEAGRLCAARDELVAAVDCAYRALEHP